MAWTSAALGSLGFAVVIGGAPLSTPALRSDRRSYRRTHRGFRGATRATAPVHVHSRSKVALASGGWAAGDDVAASGWRTWRGAPMARTRARNRGSVRCRGLLDRLKRSFGGGGASEDEDEDSDNAGLGAEVGRGVQPDEVASSSTSGADASGGDEERPATLPPAYNMPKQDFKKTMSALDALLPPDEAEEKRKAEEEADEARLTAIAEGKKDPSKSMDVTVSISPAALEALQQAERGRKQGGAPPGVDSFGGPRDTLGEGKEEKDVWLDQVVDGLSDSASRDRETRTEEENDKLDKVLADLSELAKQDKDARNSEEVRAKFDSLFEILEINDEPAVPKEDVQKLKDEVFGYNTFWVTSTEELGPEIVGEGILIKGNLRAPREEVWQKVQDGVEKLFDGKYTPFMLEEPASLLGDDDDSGASVSGTWDSSDPKGGNSRGPRVSFLIVPSDKAGPNPNSSTWQYFVGLALLGLTAGSALQLGLVAEVSRLPQATMDWLAAGSQGLDNTLAPGELPPGLEGFDSAAYVEGAFPILGGIFAAAGAHEVGHMIAAAARGVKLSIPYLIPNGQLGTFGSVTQIKSLVKTRSDMFDVAVAGPLAGSLVAGSLFVYGLVLSAGGSGDELLPIPAELFSGSLLLGGISELVLGNTAEATKGVLVHPLFIAGWCGLVTQALNCLPVGQIDGGRITQMGFGRRALGLTSLGIYLGLSLGVIASSLSLSWALYVLICQRTPEFSPQDDVTEVSEGRQKLALVIIFISLLILLPGAGGSGDIMPTL